MRVNSTAPHNRSWLHGQGSLDDADLDAVDAALDAAPRGHVVVLALHHHVLPMPEEHAMERLSSWLGLPFTCELARGRDLMMRVRGRCDLVLHGHRHVPARRAPLRPAARAARVQRRLVRTELRRAWVFAHDGVGHLMGGPLWLEAPIPWGGIVETFGEEAGVRFGWHPSPDLGYPSARMARSVRVRRRLVVSLLVAAFALGEAGASAAARRRAPASASRTSKASRGAASLEGKVAIFPLKNDDDRTLHVQLERILRSKGLEVVSDVRPVDTAEQYRELATAMGLAAFVGGELL